MESDLYSLRISLVHIFIHEVPRRIVRKCCLQTRLGLVIQNVVDFIGTS